MKYNRQKSNERVLNALKSIKTLMDQDMPVSFEKMYQVFSISRSTQTGLRELGIIQKLSNKKYQWIGSEPSIEMCESLKDYHYNKYYSDKNEDEPQIEFDSQTVDEKLNHINFMLDQLFDRVNYLFENLADNKVKDKVNSDWFKKA